MYKQRVVVKGRLVPFDASLFIYMTPSSIEQCIYDLSLVEYEGIWYKPTEIERQRNARWAVVDQVDDGTMSFVCEYLHEESSLKEVLDEQLNSQP